MAVIDALGERDIDVGRIEHRTSVLARRKSTHVVDHGETSFSDHVRRSSPVLFNVRPVSVHPDELRRGV